MIDPATPRTYFAAANSARGFVNFFEPCFSEERCEHLYIIKGGPGTGKSHLMRTVARHARRAGCEVTAYACSSDPASLDGVLCRQNGRPGIGFLDGTPPHVWEPRLPGVRESLVDLGRFWDSHALRGQEQEIRRLTDKKAAAYRRAYSLLSAAGEVDRVADERLSSCIRWPRLYGLIDRFLRPLTAGVGKHAGLSISPVPALRRALSMKGDITLNSYEREIMTAGGNVIHLQDYYGVAGILLTKLLEASLSRGISPTVSYDPLRPEKVDGLLYPLSGLCILAGRVDVPNEESTTLRSISLKRLVDPTALRGARVEMRRLIGQREALMQNALDHLGKASGHHFALEIIYKETMNFDAVTALTEELCKDLFG